MERIEKGIQQNEVEQSPDHLDGVVAAPESHKVLFENEKVRVLEVILKPKAKEPAHTHKWPSVMYITSMTDIKYYDADGNSIEITGVRPTTEYLEPEGLHAVENLDSEREYRAIRVELKEAKNS